MSELPPPLPPGERTVGQLVAESIRAYGNDFFRILPLGLPYALLDEVVIDLDGVEWFLVFMAFAPLLSLAFAYTVTIITGVEPKPRRLALAAVVGTLALVPAALLLPWFALLAVVYLAFVGLVVPVTVVEGLWPLAAVRRAVRLARADVFHALGSLATLLVLFFFSRLVLVQLLQGQADTAIRIAVLLADIVLSPLLYLGTATLYGDQVARVGTSYKERRERARQRSGRA